MNHIVTKPVETKSLVAQLTISGLCSIINHISGGVGGVGADALAQGFGFQSVLASQFLYQLPFFHKRIVSA